MSYLRWMWSPPFPTHPKWHLSYWARSPLSSSAFEASGAIARVVPHLSASCTLRAPECRFSFLFFLFFCTWQWATPAQGRSVLLLWVLRECIVPHGERPRWEPRAVLPVKLLLEILLSFCWRRMSSGGWDLPAYRWSPATPPLQPAPLTALEYLSSKFLS